MFSRQTISVGNLLLDIGNFRIVKQSSQKEALDAIIKEQQRKLVVLAKDIIDFGVNPFDSLLVVDAEDGNNNYIVIEGNRRLSAINLMLHPEKAEGTSIYKAFKKLNQDHADAIPKVLDCVIAPNKQAGQIWINRKHASGLDGAGTEHWSSISKARADQLQGIKRPDLEVVNYVLTLPDLPDQMRLFLEGSKFNISTLERLLLAKEFQDAIGLSIKNGEIASTQDRARVAGILKEIVTIIADGRHGSEKFTERNVDTEEHRRDFLAKILLNHPKKTASHAPWAVSANPVTVNKAGSANQTSSPIKSQKPKGNLSTDDRPNLIPKKFKLELPSGKIADIFAELKGLDVTGRRHAVSVLFRVFFEISVDEYLKKHQIVPLDGKGRAIITFNARLQTAKEHAKNAGLSVDKLKPIETAISDKNSLLSPDTLNAYVHSAWMNPEPLQLKIAWNNVEPFIEYLWIP